MTEGAAPARLVTLDAVRGVAVMGILLMNILAFALPQQAYFNPAAYGGSTGADFSAWAASFVLIDGKMRGLFSMLFGASMLLVIDRAEAGGQHGTRTHFARMFWLLVFGMLHYWLLWYGDILAMYAIIGTIAVLFVRKDARSLIRWAIGTFVASMLVWSLLLGSAFALDAAANAPGASADTIESAAQIREAFGEPNTPSVAKELAAYRGTWLDGVAQRGKDGPFAQFVFVLFAGLETLGLMLLGMALFRNGFLRGEWQPERYKRVIAWGYGIGIPGGIALAAIIVAANFDTLIVNAVSIMAMTPFRIAVTVAHAALIVILVTRASGTPLVARLAATGQAAFSNYIGTTLLMTTLFYGYGFGLYGDLSRWQVYLVPPVVFALMLLWSKPWLDRFRYGPLEWLWRSLARGKLQQMRK